MCTVHGNYEMNLQNNDNFIETLKKCFIVDRASRTLSVKCDWDTHAPCSRVTFMYTHRQVLTKFFVTSVRRSTAVRTEFSIRYRTRRKEDWIEESTTVASYGVRCMGIVKRCVRKNRAEETERKGHLESELKEKASHNVRKQGAEEDEDWESTRTLR